MNTTDLAQAIQNHAWPVVATTLILALVRLARNPLLAPQWQRIPAAYRPLVPVALAALSAVGDSLAGGAPWLVASLGGVVAAVPGLLLALPSPVVPNGDR